MDLLSQNPSPNYSTVLLVVMLGIVGYLLFRSKRYFARLQNNPSKPVFSSEAATRQRYANVPPAVADWEVEMHDFAREVAGQLDSKMSGLSSLIREADRAASRLEAAVAAAERKGVALRPETSALPADAPDRHPPSPPIDQAAPLKAVSSPALSAVATDASELPSPDRRYDEIYLLADYGFDTNEIARRVNIPAGEIQLILSLRTRR